VLRSGAIPTSVSILCAAPVSGTTRVGPSMCQPAASAPSTLHAERGQPVAVEPQRTVVRAAPLDPESRAHPRRGGIEIEIERDLGHAPIGLAIILAARDMGVWVAV
jgi:hypothetical protein